MALSRRTFAISALAAVAASAGEAVAQCGSQCSATFTVADEKKFRDMIAKTPIVDVHGHIFNASDLPIMEWLNEVELEAKLSEAGIEGQAKEIFDSILRGLANFNLQTTIENMRMAVPASVEAAALQVVMSSALKGDYFDKSGSPTIKYYQLLIREALAVNSYENRRFLELACRVASRNVGREISIADLRKKTSDIEIVGSRYRTAVLRKDGLDCSLTGTPRTVNAVAFFAQSLGQPRLQNAANWRRAYSGVTMEVGKLTPTQSNGFTQLMVPAILDIDHWLRFEREGNAASGEELLKQRSPMSDQVEAMSRISALNPATMAPFVGFDPWRQVEDLAHNTRSGVTPRKTALAVVKDAIEKKGFVGVKLYPVMGFRPMGNAEFDQADKNDEPFPPYLKTNAIRAQVSEGFGQKLDDAMTELFRFCHDNEVPIMAHCTDSKGAFEATFKGTTKRSSERSHPKYWKPLLLPGNNGEAAKYPTLRLNLAHMDFGTGKHGSEASWATGIKELLEHAPNVFGDTSYFSEILSEGNAKKHCGALDTFAKTATSYFKQTPGAPFSCFDKVMYGSDWYMPAMQRNFETFLNVMARAYFGAVAKTAADEAEQADRTRRFLSSNALRFLGIANPNSAAYQRYVAFFEDHPHLDAPTKTFARRRIDRLVEAALV